MDLDKVFEKVPYDKIIPLPNWQRAGGVLAVAAVILGLFYFAVIQGKNDEIGKLKESHDKIRKEVEDNKRYAQKLPKLMAKMKKLDAALKKASEILPTKKEIPELLEQVSNIGIQSGLEFVTFKPEIEVKQEFFSLVPVALTVSGKFHEVLKFFDEISHLARIVTIDNINMRSGSSQNGFTNLTVNCKATTYRFLESSERNPPPGPAGKKAKKGKKK
ncbi:hypothetical protein MNBD_NITROSPINAE03-1975 [hydrothermal vent metagenome]|uniref:Type IV pilus biogenesis protein PilO n=1 Tax=hydrothermal vent metagenome TaxID=652676 RepID=A0A3B1C8I0_9ZZZZ